MIVTRRSSLLASVSFRLMRAAAAFADRSARQQAEAMVKAKYEELMRTAGVTQPRPRRPSPSPFKMTARQAIEKRLRWAGLDPQGVMPESL